MNFRSASIRPLVLLGLMVSSLGVVSKSSAQAAPQLLPYMTSLVAGGGTTATFTVGQTCPSSGNIATDKFGDGCLATEVQLQKPRFVTTDTSGNIYFDEYTTNAVRRIDASTGQLSLVAGGATSSSVNTSCSGTANAEGDGCAANAVYMFPAGLAVSPLTGDLYIADTYNYTVRKVNLTTGIISLAAGTPRSAGFYIWNGTQYVAGTSARLDNPYGLQFDPSGNLVIAEEYKEAILVLNTSATSHTIFGLTIPAGAIAKVVGYYRSGSNTSAYCNTTNLPTTTTGCSYGTWTDGASGNASSLDNPYGVTIDPSGNVFWANEFNSTVGKLDAAGNVYQWLGKQASSSAITNTRALGSSIYIGSDFGVAADSSGNVYATDGLKGWVWRVDAGTQTAWVIAGAGTSCNATAHGDGCPAAQTVFSAGTSSNGAYVTNATSAGLYGIYSDPSDSLFIVDFAAGMIHKIATNANFGTILPTNPTQSINIHFDAGDSPGTYTITSNPQNFTLGSPTCTSNSDTTTDCLLPVTANPTAEGPFSSNLTVTSSRGKTGIFVLSGTLTTKRVASTTTLAASITSTNPATPVTLTATVAPPAGTTLPVTGTVSFYNGSTQIGTTQTLVNGQASITYTFPLGTYNVTAVYDESLFLFGSTSQPVTIQSVNPDFVVSTPLKTSLSVAPGQYALDSFSVSTAGLYTGTLTFACSGLPANSSCVFSPSSLPVGATASTVALTIKTQSTTSASLQNPFASHTNGLVLCILPGFALLLFGVRRKGRRLPSALLLVVLSAAAVFSVTGCGSGTSKLSPTPAGTYNVTVTATGTPSVTSGSTSIVHTLPLTLTVTQ